MFVKVLEKKNIVRSLRGLDSTWPKGGNEIERKREKAAKREVMMKRMLTSVFFKIMCVKETKVEEKCSLWKGRRRKGQWLQVCRAGEMWDVGKGRKF